MQENDKFKDLLEIAKEVSKKSYSPYSLFPVGAAVLFENGKIYTGCNVENASYGLSLCAERNAISTAITDGEYSRIIAIAIYSPKQKYCMPCGACRQWLSEFCPCENKKEPLKVVLEGKNQDIEIFNLDDIFPYCFKFEE